MDQLRDADDRLVRRAVGGDAAAFSKLLLRCYPDLEARIRQMLPLDLQRVLSWEDIRQTAAMTAWKDIRSLRLHSIAGFRTWLLRVAENQAISAWRAETAAKRGGRRKHVQLSLSESVAGILQNLAAFDQSPGRRLSDEELVALVDDALKTVSSSDRELMRLRYAQNLPYEQVAKALNCAPIAARQRCHRVVLYLRQLLSVSSDSGRAA